MTSNKLCKITLGVDPVSVEPELYIAWGTLFKKSNEKIYVCYFFKDMSTWTHCNVGGAW